MNKASILYKKAKNHGLDGYIISNNDQFLSEYTKDENNQLKFITNFSGSNGIAVIFNNKIHLFTDGRYEIQAKKELPHSAEIFIVPEKKFTDWLINKLAQNYKFGFNPKLFKYAQFIGFESPNLIPLEIDFIEELWPKHKLTEDHKIFRLDENYAGKSSTDKLLEVQNYLKTNSLKYLVIEDCDSISWLLNLRSNYYEFTPSVAAKFILSAEGKGSLFTDCARFTNEVKAELKLNHINIYVIEQYQQFLEKISDVNQIAVENNSTYFTYLKLPAAKFISSPIIFRKARKNLTEIEGAIEAHRKDAKALKEFYDWFQQQFNEEIYYTEFQLTQKIKQFRQKQSLYHSESFPAIIGFKKNGAIIHYRAQSDSAKLVKGEGLLLIDSGGQYFDGTTDITRTYALGNPSREQIKRYTQVLKGHISLASAKFKKGTTGAELDVLARKFLLEDKVDYQHGTGHGVGAFLNVHEGPYSISKYSNLPIIENIILSIEPGFYKENEYGIRLENLYYVKSYSEEKLYFIPLTLLPFEEKLIDYQMLSKEEKEWLEWYNKFITLNL